MNFDLTDDQRMVQETFARYADEQIAPKAEALDEAHAFPREVFEQLGELGFFGMRYPEEAGGTGLDLLSLCLAVTEIARGSASVAGVATMQSLMGTNFLWALGNDDIKQRLFAPALEGKLVGGICMTEPDSGSDLAPTAATRSTARRCGSPRRRSPTFSRFSPRRGPSAA
jgi:alkylation response protein AidB-like acyl-CoA dehydrogenase